MTQGHGGRLAGKVAVVTGAARGMGAAEARLFAEQGAQVVLTDLLPEGKQVADEIGERALFVEHDVTSEADWGCVIDETVNRFGRLDVLVNNAGVFAMKPLVKTTEQEYLDVIRVNQLGVFLGMKLVAPVMTEGGGGSIVNISSIAGQKGSTASVAYTASKFAVCGMTKVAALEFARQGIRVNSIHPGMIDTKMAEQMTRGSDEALALLQSRIPLGTMAQPHQVAAMALFLASDESDYCTGGEFVVDGGLTSTLGIG